MAEKPTKKRGPKPERLVIDDEGEGWEAIAGALARQTKPETAEGDDEREDGPRKADDDR